MIVDIPRTELEPPSVPLATSVQTQEISYYYSNTSIVGIYCSRRITCLTTGKVFNNNGKMFKQKKFKIHGVANPDGDLRIDFYKIDLIDFFKNLSEDVHRSIVNSNQTDHPEAYTRDSPDQSVQTAYTVSKIDEFLKIPDIIFLGKCPDCRS